MWYPGSTTILLSCLWALLLRFGLHRPRKNLLNVLQVVPVLDNLTSRTWTTSSRTTFLTINLSHSKFHIINAAKRKAKEEVNALGGDMPSVIANLQQKQAVDPRWQFQLCLNELLVVTGLWWQSPTQAELTRCFHNIVINYGTYNQNQYGYPLNLEIGINNFGK